LKTKIRNEKIECLFEYFNSIEGFNYALLHHAGEVFAKHNDIDIVADSTRVEVQVILNEFCAKHSCFPISNFTIDYETYRFDLVYFEGLEPGVIELDFTLNTAQKDLLEVDSIQLLKNKRVSTIGNKNIFVLAEEDELNFYIKKSAFKGKSLRVLKERMMHLPFNESDLQNKYLKALRDKVSLRYRSKIVRNKLLLLLSRLREKPSTTICFLGPDGSGKSTLINEIIESPLFIYKKYFHLKPYDTSEASNESVSEPHSKKNYGSLLGIAKVLYLFFRYHIGWFKNVLKYRFKNTLIIFDRYYDDILVDSLRYRLGNVMPLVKIVDFIIPKPDLYFVLHGSAETLYSRKQELSYKTILTLLDKYKVLAEDRGYILLDVEKPVETLVFDIVKEMSKFQNERDCI